MDSFELPPAVHCSPKRCLCGRNTIASHDYWFCSTECARQDALRSLDNPKSHYRQVVQANVDTNAPEHSRMCFDSPHSAQRYLAKPLPPIPAHSQQHRSPVPFARHVARLPTLPQVTGKALPRHGNVFVPERRDVATFDAVPNASRACPVQSPIDHPIHPFWRHADNVSARGLRRFPTVDSLVNDARKDRVGAVANFGRSGRAAREDFERVYVRQIDHVAPLATKASPPRRHETNFPSVPAQITNTPRRSASFHGACAAEGQFPLMRMVEKMREEMAESFDPKSLFDGEDDY